VSAYVRPEIVDPVFRDVRGRVIDYGRRWRGESPPEDTYSVESDLGRFAPLLEVADALIAHLPQVHNVRAEEGLDFAGDLLTRRVDVVRAVRLTPAADDAASLTFVFTSYPSVWLLAGEMTEFPFPICSCDACDETWWTQADRLEQVVFTVANGGFAEHVRLGAAPAHGYSLNQADGRQSGWTSADGVPLENLTAVNARLDALSKGWRKWPLAIGRS
jgi:hypothetical protein